MKPFVPSRVCLSCDGCCRFKEEKSSWRPRITAEEKVRGLADRIFSPDAVDEDDYLQTHCRQGGHACRFHNAADNTCRIYDSRPFECAFYPFLLTWHQNTVKVAVHLSCPFLQEHWGDGVYQTYVEYLKNDYFCRDNVLAYVRRNLSRLPDYSEYGDEIDYLFSLNLEAGEPVLDEELVEKKVLLDAYAKENDFLAAGAFVNMAAWKDHFYFHGSVMNDALCIFASHGPGTFLYGPPLGRNVREETIDDCFTFMHQVNQGGGITRIENVTDAQLGLFPEEKYSRRLKAYEYCYDRQDLTGLKGQAYKSKRSDYNHFIKNNNYVLQPFDEAILPECLTLYEKWARQRQSVYTDEIYLEMIKENQRVHRILMKHFRELGLTGRVVRVDGAVRAYTFGYPLNKDTFCVLLEITDLGIKGLAAFIFREFCADPALQSYSLINTMDDFAMPNVRRAKLSFRPTRLVPSYTITKRDA